MSDVTAVGPDTDCNMIEEAYGLMTTYEDFLEQYDVFVKQFPDFLKTFYEKNPVMFGQYLFRDEKKRSKFMKFVVKHKLCAPEKLVTEGQA